jgi:hypothetical protein
MLPHRMAEMTPLRGGRWGHPTEWSLDLVDGVLLHGGQDEAPVVRSRRYRTVVRRTVTSACAGWPSDGAVLPRGHQRPLDMRQPRRECFLGSPRHGL